MSFTIQMGSAKQYSIHCIDPESCTVIYSIAYTGDDVQDALNAAQAMTGHRGKWDSIEQGKITQRGKPGRPGPS